MSIFHLKYFSLHQREAAMKVGTDAMVLGALVRTESARHILDVGTGTGILALMCAQHNTAAHIVGLEIDPAASQECTRNFAESPWPDRLTAVCADFLDWSPIQFVDLIVSNPPYYQTAKENDDARLSLARHVGELSPARFFDKVATLVSDTGRCEIIVPAQDEGVWCEAARASGLFLARRVTVFGKSDGPPKRSVLSFQRTEAYIEEGQLTIREADGRYTAAYVELTREFHGVVL